MSKKLTHCNEMGCDTTKSVLVYILAYYGPNFWPLRMAFVLGLSIFTYYLFWCVLEMIDWNQTNVI